MAAPLHQYGAYRLALDLITGNFVAAIGHLLRMFYGTDQGPDARDQFVRAAAPIMEKFRQQNYDAGVNLIHDEAARAGYTPDKVNIPDIVPFNEVMLSISMTSMTGGANRTAFSGVLARLTTYVEAPARYLMTDLAADAPHGVEEPSADALSKAPPTPGEEAAQARQAKAQEIKDRFRARAGLSGSTHGLKWKYARVLTGAENCAFCIMLASRGAVYGSEKKAEGDLGDGFHTHCDCIAVPVLNNDFPFHEEAGRLYNIYKDAQDAPTAVTGTKRDALNSLRTYLDANNVEIPDLRTLPDRKPLG